MRIEAPIQKKTLKFLVFLFFYGTHRHTHIQTDGHCNLETESAQWANLVKSEKSPAILLEPVLTRQGSHVVLTTLLYRTHTLYRKTSETIRQF